MQMFRVIAILMVASFGLGGLSVGSGISPPQPVPTPPPEIVLDQAGAERTQLSVLTYNVFGLPWPVARDRGTALDRIGRELRRLQEAGRAPDVVLVQEAFTDRARRIGELAGYPYRVAGPRAGDAPTVELEPLDAAYLDGQRMLRGEGIGKILSSGLAIYSRYPLRVLGATPFGADSCAGYDCLANKGVMLVAVEVPGVPQPVQLMNTHVNANGASGVPRERALTAHHRQIDEIVVLLERDLRADWPLIFGGDLNVRDSDRRFDYTAARLPGSIVHRHCTLRVAACDVRMSWDGDEPWMDTQDHQGFSDGERVRVRPGRVEAMFDAPRDGRQLSDHDGFLVTYELSWPPAPAPAHAAVAQRVRE